MVERPRYVRHAGHPGNDRLQDPIYVTFQANADIIEYKHRMAALPDKNFTSICRMAYVRQSGHLELDKIGSYAVTKIEEAMPAFCGR